VRHHDALRLRFTHEGGVARQRYAEPAAPLDLPVVDLSAEPAERRAAALEAHAAEFQASLDLAEGPLLRAAWFSVPGLAASGRLLILIHHLVVDGVSWRILLEDLEAAYSSLRRGEAPQLPPRTTSFQRWAQALSRHAASASVREELPFWLAVPAAVPLPVDRE